MNPRQQNLQSTLNLLVLLFRSRQQTIPPLPDEQQHLLIVTKEHIQTTNLDIPVFINTLNLIGRKGYFFALSIFEEKYHPQFREFQTPQFYNKFIKSIESNEKNTLSKEQKEKLYEPFLKLVPKKLNHDFQELINEDLTVSTLLTESKEVIGGHSSEVVSYILLFPYRKIDSLLSRLENGESFEGIQDQEIWFEVITNSFHYNNGAIDVGKTKRAKEVFKALFSQDTPTCVYFDEIPESSQDSFNKKEQKAYYDSLNRFLLKDLKLKQIFELYQDRFEIRPEYRDKAH